MAIRNGEDEGMPIAPRVLRRDILRDGTDVTLRTERELLLRAVNSTLATEEGLGRVLGELGEVRSDVADIKRRLQPNGEIEHRARAVSSHTFEGALEGVAARIVEAVHDDRDGGRGNVSTGRVLEMIREYDVSQKEKIADERRKWRRELTVAIIAALVGVVATGVAGEMHGRANAPQTQGHP